MQRLALRRFLRLQLLDRVGDAVPAACGIFAHDGGEYPRAHVVSSAYRVTTCPVASTSDPTPIANHMPR